MEAKISDHFKRSEFACRCGCGFDAVDFELLEVLEDCVANFEAKTGMRLEIIINSGNRCPARNIAEKGAKRSKHKKGIAADFRISSIDADQVADYLDDKYPNKYGLGRYDDRTHIDIRPYRARWDERTAK
jgi:uncharacterized protein YcbK (DUF882 family)